MKRVGVYVYRARVDIEGIIKAQLDKLQAYADEHGGTVVDRYVDIGCAGHKRGRMSFKRMLKDCQDRKLDEVLILRARHLSRKAEEFWTLYNRITENNVALNIVEEPITEEFINLLQIIGVVREKGKLQKDELISAGCEALLNEYGPKKIE